MSITSLEPNGYANYVALVGPPHIDCPWSDCPPCIIARIADNPRAQAVFVFFKEFVGKSLIDAVPYAESLVEFMDLWHLWDDLNREQWFTP